MKKNFYSNGKLLLTGEYAILDGAKALAVPTKYGQGLSIQENDSGIILWNSLDHNQNVWFKAKISFPHFKIISSSNEEIANTLVEILIASRNANKEFLHYETGLSVSTSLGFSKKWGLGSSSTLINNIANWAQIDPYYLLEQTFGGSGYDLACAQHNKPIIYQLNDSKATVKEINFVPSFIENLFFIYLNKKQNSRDAIQNYRKQRFDQFKLVSTVSSITDKIIETKALSEFETLLKEHEIILSKVLQLDTVQEKLFPDYFGVVKSLGGWGGDFVLATGNEKTPEYFKSRGFNVVIPYQDMVL